jgi:ABC-type branched-subunit amino acid transport system substrate-binding protein
MTSTPIKWTGRLRATLQLLSGSFVKWVVTPAVGAILAFIIGARVTDFFGGPDHYKIYVVGKLGSEDELKNLFDGIPDGIVQNVTIDDKPIKVEQRDDKGDAHYAEQIAAEISQKEDALLVVGHIFSTSTKAALPYYLGSTPQAAHPPVPVILTTETNPDLLPPTVSEGFCPPALRLSPTDDEQASQAAVFGSSVASNFWVVADVDNGVYSQYLTNKFISRITDQKKHVALSSTSQSMPPLDVLKALKIDGVFFAGQWAPALVLIRQINLLKALGTFPKGPSILLSDGSVDKSLLGNGGSEVNGVFLTHQLSATEFTDATKGYKKYGEDAYGLARRMIEQADKEFANRMRARSRLSYWLKQALKVHRVSDARAVLDGVIQEYVTQRKSPTSLTDCLYQRKANGDPVTPDDAEAKFHVWRVQNGQFLDCPDTASGTCTK